MHVLALDTSTHLGSVAVVSDGRCSAELAMRVRARHGETLLPNVEHVLQLAGIGIGDVGVIAVGIGPGSFTGLRVGLATAKGLAFARGVPLVGVVSLRALARGLGIGDLVTVPVVDAHKGEIFAAAYEPAAGDAIAEELVAPFHGAPARVARHLRAHLGARTLALCGDGLRRYEDEFMAALGEPSRKADPIYDSPRAALLARDAVIRYQRGEASDLASLEPLYVRPSDAKPPA